MGGLGGGIKVNRDNISGETMGAGIVRMQFYFPVPSLQCICYDSNSVTGLQDPVQMFGGSLRIQSQPPESIDLDALPKVPVDTMILPQSLTGVIQLPIQRKYNEQKHSYSRRIYANCIRRYSFIHFTC